MIDFNGPGFNAPQAQGMSPDFGSAMFQNIQLAANAANRNRKQQVLDNTGRFGQTGSGAQLQQLDQADRDTADQTIQAQGNAQLQGAQAGQQNRQFNAGLNFQGQQGDLNRMFQYRQLGQQKDQFDYNAQQQELNRLLGMIGTGAGALTGGWMNRPPAAVAPTVP